MIVTAGGKQALYNSAMVLFEEGDEVITHGPFWPSIVDQVKLAGANPVIVHTHMEDGFAIHADAVIEAMTPRTKAIIINSPCNPTGALITEERDGRHRRRGRAAWPVGDCRPDLRKADLRSRAAQPRAGPDRSDAGPDGDLRRGIEGLRHDRMALRLGNWPSAIHQRNATSFRGIRRRTSRRSRRRRRWRRSPARRTA